MDMMHDHHPFSDAEIHQDSEAEHVHLAQALPSISTTEELSEFIMVPKVIVPVPALLQLAPKRCQVRAAWSHLRLSSNIEVLLLSSV